MQHAAELRMTYKNLLADQTILRTRPDALSKPWN